jgi:hypothetical protein
MMVKHGETRIRVVVIYVKVYGYIWVCKGIGRHLAPNKPRMNLNRMFKDTKHDQNDHKLVE